jgi:hypothetical protein
MVSDSVNQRTCNIFSKRKENTKQKVDKALYEKLRTQTPQNWW